MKVWYPLILRLVVLILPVFIVWKVTAEYFLAPSINYLHNQWVMYVFEDIDANLLYEVEHKIWQVNTHLFKPKIKKGHKTYDPKLIVNKFIHIPLGSLVGYTQGLILLWLMVLLLSKDKVKHLLIGSGIQVVVVILVTSLIIIYQINSTISSELMLQVLSKEGAVVIPNSLPPILLTMAKPVLDSLSYVMLYISPLLLAYYYCNSIIYEYLNMKAE